MRVRLAFRVYMVACFSLVQSNSAIICRSLAPISAQIVAAAFFKPCAVQCGSSFRRSGNFLWSMRLSVPGPLA